MKAVFDGVDSLKRDLDFHHERQSVLSGNLANLETPGYRPKDLLSFREGLSAAMPLARTDSAHLSAPGTQAAGSRLVEDPSDSAQADGNAVVLERELAKIDSNRLRYNTFAELVTRRLALLRYGASDGNP